MGAWGTGNNFFYRNHYIYDSLKNFPYCQVIKNAVQHCEKVYPFEPVYISSKSKPDSFNPEQKELREELSVFSQDSLTKIRRIRG